MRTVLTEPLAELSDLKQVLKRSGQQDGRSPVASYFRLRWGWPRVLILGRGARLSSGLVPIWDRHRWRPAAAG